MPRGMPSPVSTSKPKQIRPTHFLCLPLTTDDSVRQLNESLAYFKSITTPLASQALVSTSDNDTGAVITAAWDGNTTTPDAVAQTDTLRILPEAAHRPAGTFHLTIGTMDLLRDEDMSKAVRLLHDIDFLALLRDCGIKEPAEIFRGGFWRRGGVTKTSKARQTDRTAAKEGMESLSREISPPPPPPKLQGFISKPTETTDPLRVTLSGLSVFPQLKEARVFYAIPHDTSNRLQTFANITRRIFREEGLITETRQLTLHATVANLIYVRERDMDDKIAKAGEGGKLRGRRKAGRGRTVDATEVLRFCNETPSENDLSQSVLANSTSSCTAQGSELDRSSQKPILWASDVPVTSVRLCKMGAEASEKPGWGLEYPPVAENVFMPHEGSKDAAMEHEGQ
jgi:hypothetical protein